MRSSIRTGETANPLTVTERPMIYSVGGPGWNVVFDDPSTDILPVIKKTTRQPIFITRGLLWPEGTPVLLEAPQGAICTHAGEFELRIQLGMEGLRQLEQALARSAQLEPTVLRPGIVVDLAKARAARQKAPAAYPSNPRFLLSTVRRKLTDPPHTQRIYMASVRGRIYAFAHNAEDVDDIDEETMRSGRFVARAMRMRYAGRIIDLDVAADEVWWFDDERSWPDDPDYEWP